jgi:hypothetical protein
LGTIILVWFVTHLAAILLTILILAAVDNGLAAMLGLTYLLFALLTHRWPMPPAARQSQPVIPPAAHYPAPTISVPVYQPQQHYLMPVYHPMTVKPEPAYVPESRKVIGRQLPDGSVRWNSSHPAN